MTTKLMLLFTVAVLAASCSRPVKITAMLDTDPKPPMHCQFIQAGEIEAIIGDGSGFGTRPGVWLMSSKHRPFNLFKTNSSGLLCGEFRGKPTTKLEYVDDSTAALIHEPTQERQVHARATFRAVSPYYLDHELTFRDLERYQTLEWGYRDIV